MTPVGTLVHNEFKFLSVSCTLSLEVMNTPGTEKVIALNLTRTCFFKRNFAVSSKIFGLIHVCLCFVGLELFIFTVNSFHCSVFVF